MVVAFSFLFLLQGCRNFLLTLTDGTTSVPASGRGAEAAWISSSYSIQGHSDIFEWWFPACQLPEEQWDDLSRLGYPWCTCLWGCAAWQLSPLGNQCPHGLCWRAAASFCRHCWNSAHVFYRFSVVSVRVLSSCSKVEIGGYIVGWLLNSSPNG